MLKAWMSNASGSECDMIVSQDNDDVSVGDNNQIAGVSGLCLSK